LFIKSKRLVDEIEMVVYFIERKLFPMSVCSGLGVIFGFCEGRGEHKLRPSTAEFLKLF